MSMHKSMKVTILCSGFGLGFYTPGLLMQAGLRRLGVETAIHVFENVLPESARLKVDKSRKAYHDNFAVALMSQKVPQDMRNSLDLAAMEVLLTRWMEEDRRHFICLSGTIGCMCWRSIASAGSRDRYMWTLYIWTRRLLLHGKIWYQA